MKLRHLFLFCVICCSVSISAQNKSKLPKTSGNPIFPGWYADPEGIVFGDEYWIYPTYSAAYDDQIFMDAFSSKDLVNWTKHPKVLSKENISWLRRALWAPAVIHANDKYYFFFGANDIQNNNELGGIGVAVADNPAGPFKDALGKPLIDKIVNGAQPIDQFVFKDDDGQYYMYYGGWGHCNMVKMAPDINKIGDKYVMYYSMSTWGGEWTCGIGIATADKPEGPFTDLGKLFRSNEINIQNCIDPFYIEDNGKKYLFWGSFHGIYGTELTDDGLSLKKGAPIEQIAGTAYEGTYIHKRDGYYYLFASIGRCCEGLKSTYTTVVGRSKNLFGPYVDKKGRSMSDNHHEILIQKNKAFVGPGHNSELVTDKKGNDWMFYHAVSVANPEGRVLMMDRVQWKGGWPFVKGAVPSLETAAPDFR